ncbi:hypothetical protein MPSEU_000935600 [Mayamaea pseudoterrestris]|nr:hypothetical protein MPSEU_000935600 [Mayamaea pseudoterrestris]
MANTSKDKHSTSTCHHLMVLASAVQAVKINPPSTPRALCHPTPERNSHVTRCNAKANQGLAEEYNLNTSFRPVDSHEGSSEHGEISSPPRIQGKRKVTMFDDELESKSSSSLSPERRQDYGQIGILANAKRFKLPCSSIINLKMRPTFLFRDTTTKLSCKTNRSLGLKQLDEPSLALVACQAAPNASTPPRTLHDHNGSPPALFQPTTLYRDDERSGPFPSRVCLPLL